MVFANTIQQCMCVRLDGSDVIWPSSCHPTLQLSSCACTHARTLMRGTKETKTCHQRPRGSLTRCEACFFITMLIGADTWTERRSMLSCAHVHDCPLHMPSNVVACTNLRLNDCECL
jgi:hypothetical protein